MGWKTLGFVVAAAVQAGGAWAGGGVELRPAGAEQILDAVRRPGASVVVLNVWATWCQPCREEFPDLMRLRREYGGRGLRLILVSADFPDALDEARAFLEAHGVEGPSFLKEGDDMAFINALHPDWTGALPATFVYDARGVLRDFWEGRRSYETMEQAVLKLLGDPPPEGGGDRRN